MMRTKMGELYGRQRYKGLINQSKLIWCKQTNSNFRQLGIIALNYIITDSIWRTSQISAGNLQAKSYIYKAFSFVKFE